MQNDGSLTAAQYAQAQQAMINQINQVWDNKQMTIDGQNLTSTVVLNVVQDGSGISAPSENTVTFSNGTGTSTVANFNNGFFFYNPGNPQNPTGNLFTYAHEFGHFLGLQDRYNYYYRTTGSSDRIASGLGFGTVTCDLANARRNFRNFPMHPSHMVAPNLSLAEYDPQYVATDNVMAQSNSSTLTDVQWTAARNFGRYGVPEMTLDQHNIIGTRTTSQMLGSGITSMGIDATGTLVTGGSLPNNFALLGTMNRTLGATSATTNWLSSRLRVGGDISASEAQNNNAAMNIISINGCRNDGPGVSP